MKWLVNPDMSELHNGGRRVSIGPEVAGKHLQFRPLSHLNPQRVWLSQAAHVFHSLNIGDNFDSYVIAGPAAVKVECFVPENVPTGYLFLCPPHRALKIETATKHIAYWSLDPMGRTHLSTEEARAHGFPDLLISRYTDEFRWDASVYEEFRALHIAKGFDPDSQDIARHLGYPLFELVSDIKARKHTAAFLDEDWEDDGWTVADLFVLETQPTPSLDESACMNSKHRY
ncbi:hypothetical protein C8F01DRAFT_332231 [Mycena amicta]|nr:hypothetical protein C8F01DRAFT_332231 [Mycena amicta]